MGQKRDMKQRKTRARVDDEMTRSKVKLARDIIYNRNYVVNSKAVEAILKAQSWVPTTVSVTLTIGQNYKLTSKCRMYSRGSLVHLVSTHTKCLSSILCMNLS